MGENAPYFSSKKKQPQTDAHAALAPAGRDLLQQVQGGLAGIAAGPAWRFFQIDQAETFPRKKKKGEKKIPPGDD